VRRFGDTICRRVPNIRRIEAVNVGVGVVITVRHVKRI